MYVRRLVDDGEQVRKHDAAVDEMEKDTNASDMNRIINKKKLFSLFDWRKKRTISLQMKWELI